MRRGALHDVQEGGAHRAELRREPQCGRCGTGGDRAGGGGEALPAVQGSSCTSSSSTVTDATTSRYQTVLSCPLPTCTHWQALDRTVTRAVALKSSESDRPAS